MAASRLALVALVLLLVAPSAGAVATREDQLLLAWRAEHAPAVIAAGELHFSGAARGGLIAAHPSGWTMKAETLVVDNASALVEQTYPNAELRVSGGVLLWKLDNTTPLVADLRATYGLGIALTNAPGDIGAGAIIVGNGTQASASWSGPETQVIPMDARVTLTSNGAPVPGWQDRVVNPGARGSQAPEGGTLLRTRGAVTLQGQADALGLGTSDASLAVARAAHDGFSDAVKTAGSLQDLFGNGGGDSPQQSGGNPFSPGGPLDNLAALSPVLNGAILVAGGNGNDTKPTAATFGADPFDVGPFSVMRSKDLALAWKDGQVKVQGTPALLITKNGAAVPTGGLAWGLPILALVLWVAAIASIVFFFVKRPEKAKASWSWRLLGWAVWALAFVIAFVVWDVSFNATFGTSFLEQVKANGLSLPTLESASLILGLELVPWSLASLLFALPIRIVLGVAFRYLSKGKSWKGFAKAGGVLSLALFAPLYGLVLVNFAVMLGLRIAGVR